MPEGLVSQNKPIEKKYDKVFFPIGGVMTPFEGKVWKANVVVKEGVASNGRCHISRKALTKLLQQ
jgi:hypothetical protein